MVELDQFKSVMNAYEEPLKEMWVSLCHSCKGRADRRAGEKDAGA